MSCSPAELQHKISALTATWQAYTDDPSFEFFVEFVLSLNSFSEFLISRGLSGLHKQARDLEQLALNLFGDESAHPVTAEQMGDLDARVKLFCERISTYIDANARPLENRRITVSPVEEPVLNPGRLVWFIGLADTSYFDLMTQLSYFDITIEHWGWDNVPESANVTPTIVMDVAGVNPVEWSNGILAMRKRFPTSNLIAVSVSPDFQSLKTALAAGCDLCFPVGTPLPAIVAKILELNDREEEDPYKVLIVEDSLTAIKLIQRTLAESDIESYAITHPGDVLDALKRYQPDLILLDMHMPGCTGVEAARVVRQHAQFLSIPIVYLSGETDVAMQIDALRLGGDHFLTKPFNPVWLSAIVNSKIERYRSIRRSMQQDSLTGLLNHTSSKRALDHGVSVAILECIPYSVAMVDIDHFKRVNDDYGHPVGDQIIRSLAWLLKQRLRKGDVVGRYGGEEFVVGLPGATADEALEIVDRIRRDFSNIRHPTSETWFNTTFSSGIACYPLADTADALVEKADEALYRAKRAGRNRVVIASV